MGKSEDVPLAYWALALPCCTAGPLDPRPSPPPPPTPCTPAAASASEAYCPDRTQTRGRSARGEGEGLKGCPLRQVRVVY